MSDRITPLKQLDKISIKQIEIINISFNTISLCIFAKNCTL